MKKNILNKALVIFSICLIIFSCTDDSEVPVLDSTASTGITQFSTTDLILSQSLENENAITISFQQPEFGYEEGSISYQLLFDIDSEFNSPEVIDGGNTFSVDLTNIELNNILINLGAEPDEVIELFVRVETVLSSDSSLFSEINSITVTPYSADLDLSSRWGLVGSATPNAWNGPDMPFYKSTDSNLADGTFVAYVTLVDGDIKIRADNAWTIEYGDNDSDNVLDAGGSNITVTAGAYKILFNENSLSYSVEPYSWGIVGSATPNAWDGPDVQFNYNPLKDNWDVETALADGDIKIRFNNAWAIEYGDNEPDNVLDSGGSNITLTAGSYFIIFDPVTLEYSIESI